MYSLQAAATEGRFWLVTRDLQAYSDAMQINEYSDEHYPALDPDVCRRARLARDSRFDGEFFLGVRTTGIYCRPICPARTPAERNVTYFRLAAQAAQAGFRPCLRCRPESAPGSPAWMGTGTTVGRAFALIGEGALNNDSVANLALRLGVGERYLRKLFQREMGTSPLAIALHQRLEFARKLLTETGLPVTEVAFGAGFGSVRRFNSAVRQHYGVTPGQLRRQPRRPGEGGVRLQLQYRPPYDWEGVLDFFRRHAIAGVECVEQQTYQRSLLFAEGPGCLKLQPQRGRNALLLELHLPTPGHLMSVVAAVRRMFDLDANPAVIAGTLASDPALAGVVEQFPGVRSPCHASPFEAAVRAIVGQQVSVAAARTVLSRIAEAGSPPGQPRAFPTAAAIAALPDDRLAMPSRRRASLRALCAAYTGCEGTLTAAGLAAIPGVGPWTRSLVAMRGFGDPDAFPAGDLGLARAWERLATAGGQSPAAPMPTQGWRPWGSYAANLLWRSLTP